MLFAWHSHAANEFTLFDNGENPSLIGASRLVRRELAYVRYQTQSLFSKKQPRELLVGLPGLLVQPDGALSIATIKPFCQKETIAARLVHETNSLLVLVQFNMIVIVNRSILIGAHSKS